MPILSRLHSLWKNLTRRGRVDRELDDELRSYLAILVDEKIRAGMTPDAARRAALVEVGGMEQVKHGVRETRSGALADSVIQDVRYGARGLLRTPGFTTAAVLALALGIGATTAIFSVVNAVLLRPLPYADPKQLVVVLHGGTGPVAPLNYRDWREQNSAFESMGAAEYWQPNVTGGDTPERILAVRVTYDVLIMLGVRPMLGRLFRPEDEEAGKEHVVVLSHGFWRRRFSGDRGVIGQTLMLNGAPYTIVGIMPPGFGFPTFWAAGAQLWAPLQIGPHPYRSNGGSLRTVARIKPGVTLAQARADMATVTARLEQEYPGTNRDIVVRPLLEITVGDVRPALLVLFGAVGFLLLITCANVAHMLLARAGARHREITLRTALGAARSRIVRQFVTESVVLALAGGVTGVLMARWGVRGFIAIAGSQMPRAETIGIDVLVLAFSLAIALGTGIVFGVVPALRATRIDLANSLKDAERGSSGGVQGQRLRNLLVGSEVALASMLLIGAGLMMRSFAALQSIDPGFNPRNVLSMVVAVAGSREAEPGRRLLFYNEAIDRVRAVPGVESASAINHLPLAGDIWGFPFYVEGRPLPRPGERPSATYRLAFPGYFETMRIPILRGRGIAATDDSSAAGVVVVNEFMAKQYWPGEDAIGKRITLGSPDKNPVWLTVIGVAKNDVRSDWSAPAEEEMFLPFLQAASSAGPYMTVVARTGGDPTLLVPAARRAIWALDPSVAIAEVQTMDEVIDRSTTRPRINVLLLGTFASVALALAAIGIYGVMSYAVSRRVHEIGIRMALGATAGDVSRLVIGQGMRVVLVGASLGLAGAFALTRLMQKLLYGVGATDPLTFVVVPLVLTGIAFVANYLPARRATRVDPLSALRAE